MVEESEDLLYFVAVFEIEESGYELWDCFGGFEAQISIGDECLYIVVLKLHIRHRHRDIFCQHPKLTHRHLF